MRMLADSSTRRLRRAGTVLAAALALLIAMPASPTAAGQRPESVLDFSDGTLDGWRPTGSASGIGVVQLDGDEVLEVADRATDWTGIESPSLFSAGETYHLSMRVRLADGTPATHARFVVRPDYTWVGDVAVTADRWTTVSGTYTVPMDAGAGDTTIYIGTGDLDAPFTYYVDDVRVSTDASIRATAPIPVGVAIDQRETTGAAASLVTTDFAQVTAENHMKPDAWYDARRDLRIDPQAAQIMAFAKENGLRVYGHTLVWHRQTPTWFFQDADGRPLTSSPAHQDLLRQRLHDHIHGVARILAERYGEFGAGNPVVAFDVVNEVVDDGGAYQDGLRRSEWYRILGESFIDLAFQYADEAFNDDYAAAGAIRPVSLFINDYSTEYAGKRARYHALVERLLERHVPIDGVGHQFHVSMSLPVTALEAALVDFASLPVTQAVTEFDLPAGSRPDAAALAAQEDYYRSAFEVFYAHAESLFSVTVWGLNDGRSWRAGEGAPLLFDDDYRGKPAYRGVLDAAPPPTQPGAAVSATVESRCVAGRVVLVVVVRTDGETAADVTATSPFGERRIADLEPGRRAGVAFTTRSTAVPAGTVAVLTDGTPAAPRHQVHYPAGSCGPSTM